jgi:hypothetical protein
LIQSHEPKYIHSRYFQISDEDFDNNETILIESDTGTGKTTETARHVKRQIVNHCLTRKSQGLKILTIVSNIKLSEQHIESFNKAGIKLTSYLNENKNIHEDNMTFCINSLMALSSLTNKELSNYIVYIDEATTFLFDLTHNDTLRNHLNICYKMLIRIMKHCYKLVLSDAEINDGSFLFIEPRIKNCIKIPLFIINTYKNYDGITAYHMHNKYEHLNKKLECVENGQYFLNSSDSKRETVTIYTKCLEMASQADKDNSLSY